MREFNFEDISTAKGRQRIPLSGKTRVNLKITSQRPVQLFAMRGGEAHFLETGTDFTFKAQLLFYDALVLKGTGQTAYHYRLGTKDLQQGEPLDHESPPAPPLPGADNLVAQFNRMLRDQSKVPYLEPEEFHMADRYLIDEEDERFEEEILEEQRAAAASADENDADEGPEDDPAPTGGESGDGGGDPTP